MDEKCVELQELVSGSLSPEYLSDIESSRHHWQGCERCQHSFPDAMEKLDAIVDKNLCEIRQNLQSLQDQYREEEKRIVAESEGMKRELEQSRKEDEIGEGGVWVVYDVDPETRHELSMVQPKRHTRLIMALADAGCKIQSNFQFMNDNWGLDGFHVAHYYHGGEYESQVCAPFVASLSGDVQAFIFEAVLAADLVESHSEEVPVEFGSTIYWMIEHAAPEFLRRYLENELKSQLPQGSSTTLAAPIEKQLSEIPAQIQSMGQQLEDLKDIGDSLKAGQNETLRVWDRHFKRAADFEPRLVEALGRELYSKLDDGTQRDLQLAESYFSNNPEPDDYLPSINRFYSAFVKEFRRQVMKPLICSLVDKKYVNYPAEEKKEPILNNGAYNSMAPIHKVLGLLEKDPVVRDIVKGLGLYVDEIRRNSNELKHMRNMAIHEDRYRREDAARVREMVLGENSILRLLFRAN